MADSLFEAMEGGSPRAGGAELLRLDPLSWRGKLSDVSFSGGVSEYIYGGEAKAFGDIGPQLAAEVRARLKDWGPQLARPEARIRATVIGASQYTMQVSGTTIFVWPLADAAAAQRAGDRAELCARRGDDRFRRGRRRDQERAQAARSRRRRKSGRDLRAVARLGDVPAARRFLQGRRRRAGGGDRATAIPIVLAGDGDVGGLIGIHYCEEMKFNNPIVSIDGLELKEFDYIDIGAILDTSGAVPVVIKSLIFPTSAGVGKDWEAERAVASVAAAAVKHRLMPSDRQLRTFCALHNRAAMCGEIRHIERRSRAGQGRV